MNGVPKGGPLTLAQCEDLRDSLRACKEERRLLKAVLRNALRHINALAWAVEAELAAAGPDEVRQHPTLRGHKRTATAARKAEAAMKAHLGDGR